ncbi:MAG: hypothetical protein H0U49_11825 [Parachlamydiaceae bacterium]|nr:hypothetical protein [Parachlamydiaceae bacterium]
MKLFEIDDIPLTHISDNDHELAHHLMLKALKNPSSLIDNVQTHLKAAVYKGSLLPVAINEKAFNTSHVCSMHTTFVSYARQELRHINKKPVKNLLLGLVSCLDGILKAAKIDRVVSNNNFFLATCLYPSEELNEKNLSQYIHNTAQEFKGHAILFKSLNMHTNAKLMLALKNIGCHMMPSREIFLFDPALKDYTAERHYQKDLKALKNCKTHTLCPPSEFTENDFERMAILYKMLYIDKHSIYNPMFNREYMRQSHASNFIKYYGLRNEKGILDGFIGFYERHNVTSTPVVGYDTTLLQELGLYRMLMAHAISRAHTHELILNLSSGASEFKLRRGAVSFIEYHAVYTKHLKNYFQKLTWGILNSTMTHLGIPIMKKFL